MPGLHPVASTSAKPTSSFGPVCQFSNRLIDFGSDVGAAVEWWSKEFKGDPATLRPPPAGPP
jgi:hypothetical protein